MIEEYAEEEKVAEGTTGRITGGEGEWNKIHAVRQIYALLGFLNVCSFA